MAVRVPSLGFHFSPARYHRLMEILKIFQDSDSENDSSNLAHLWDQADLEGWSSLLTWKVCRLFLLKICIVTCVTCIVKLLAWVEYHSKLNMTIVRKRIHQSYDLYCFEKINF